MTELLFMQHEKTNSSVGWWLQRLPVHWNILNNADKWFPCVVLALLGWIRVAAHCVCKQQQWYWHMWHCWQWECLNDINNSGNDSCLWFIQLCMMCASQRVRLDTVLCKHKHTFTWGLFTGSAAARNNFGGPRVNNIKGHFSRIALAYPHFVCCYRLVS